MTTEETIRKLALAQLADTLRDSYQTEPDRLERLWDSVFTNCTVGEIQIVQLTLTALNNKYGED